MKTKRISSSGIFCSGRWQTGKPKFYSSSGIVLFIMILFMTLGGQSSFGQGVGISEGSITPEPWSILELRSTLRGFLAPRMDSGERAILGLKPPAAGMLVYDTDTKSFWYWDGSWKAIAATGLGTSNQLLGMNNAGDANEYKSLNGSANIIVTHTLNNIGLNTIQDIQTTSSVSFSSLTLTNPLTVPYGGTGMQSGVSGGIPYFSSPTSMGSSALLTANGVVIGGGAGTAPYTIALGSTGQVLQSNGSGTPSWSIPTYPSLSGAAGQIIRSNGTNNIYSTSAFADTYAASSILFSSGLNNIVGLATANNGVLVTDIAGVPSISSTLPFAVQDNITRTSTITSGTWQGTLIGLGYGGTNADLSLSASNGGIVWSNATQFQILPGIATSNRMLLSGASATPGWSSYSMPASFTGGGEIMYSSNATTISNLAAGTTGMYLKSNGTGAPTWQRIDLSSPAEINNILPIAYGGTNSGTALSGRSLMISNGSAIVQAPLMTNGQVIVGSTGLDPQVVTLAGDATINNTGTLTISNNAITTPKIADANVTPVKIQPGAINQVLVTDALGAVAWINRTAFGALSDGLSIEGDGTIAFPFRVKDLGIITAKLADGAVTTVKLADDAVTTIKILDANVTNSKLADNSVTTSKIVDANVTTSKILDANVTNSKLADNSVTTGKIVDANVTPVKIQPGAINQVLVTDALGAVAWINRNAFGALSDGLSIEGDGTIAFPFRVKDLGIITAKLADGAVTTMKLADDAVTTIKILDANVTNSKLADNSVTTSKIVDANVTTSKILDANVTNSKLADNSVTTSKIVDANVTTSKILDANVTNSKLADNSVTTGKIVDANVTPVKIQPGAINQVLVTDALGAVAWINRTAFGALSDGLSIEGDGTIAFPFRVKDLGIITAKLADGAVTTVKLADDAVTTIKILDANVTNSKLADNSVTTSKIVDANVTTSKILDANVTNSKLADNSVTTSKIVDANVTTSKILDANVTNSKLADNSVTTSKIVDANVTPVKIQPGAINQVLVTDALGAVAWINRNAFGALSDGLSIEGDGTNAFPFRVKDLGIITAKLADGAVTTVKLADDAVTTIKILDANVTNSKLADNSVTTSKIVDANVTTSKILDANVTNSKLADNSVTTSKIVDANVTPVKIQPGAINQVLVTDALGAVAWINRNAFGALSDGLSIEGDGTIAFPFRVKDLGIITAKLADGAVTTVKLADDAVTTIKILDANVTNSKLADNSVTTSKIVDANVTASKILDANVTNSKLADNSVTYAKMQNVSTTSRLLGSSSTTTPVQEITLGSGLTLTNNNLTASGFGGTVTDFISNDLSPLFTTSVATSTTTPTLSFNLTNAGANTVFGNNSGGAAAPAYFTPQLASSLFANQGNTNQVLHGGGVGNPSWGQINNGDIANNEIDLTSKVTGILPLLNGGTGANNAAGARVNIGLGNVDNTSDLSKPISTLTQAALDLKAALASPTFTGVPLSPTALAGTNTTQIATTEFVTTAVTAATPDATTLIKGKVKLAGDLGGTADLPSVVTVGGSTAASVNAATLLANAATDANTAGTIVKRDGTGNFSAGMITANLTGNVTGNASTVTTNANLSGDVSSAGNVTTLATVNTVTPGTYGTGTSVPTITVNGKGLVTASSATSIAFPVTLAGNETLTNKTLTSPVITTPTGIVKGDIGLGNVDNTSDLSKPISTLTQAALDLKAALASPTFTGVPLSPTALAGTNTTQIATTEFVTTAVTAATPDATTLVKGKVKLAGDLGGTADLPSVVTVGGSTAASVNAATLLANAATDANTAGTIVKRDGTGNFSAGMITANLTGNVTGNASTVTTNANLSGDVSSAGNVTTLATVNTVTPGTYGTGTSVPTITVNGKGLVTASSATSIAFPVTLAGNETLTNKTLTSPVITTPTGIVKGDIGLGNVDNTSDLSKPISTLTQAALDLKAALASPTFTGVPLSPTALAGTNTTQIATTEFVTTAVTAATPDATTLIKGKVKLAGDLGGTADLPSVVTVGGSTAASVNAATLLANAATDANTAGTIVKRDGTGNFSAGMITANLTGNVTGNASTVTTNANLSGDVSSAGNVTTLATVNTVTPGTYGTGTSVPTITVNGKGLVTASSATSIAFPVTLAGNETLTNKTLTSPVITTPTGIVKGDIGLGNVDNTSDLSKPISTLTQAALDLKAALASPTFTGVPLSPTALAGTNTTQIATTEFVTTAVTAATPDATTLVKGKVKLAGDLGGTADLPSVVTVGGSTAASVNAATLLANAATDANTAGTIVKRDGTGNFSAGMITANLTGNVTGNASTVTTNANLSGDVSSAGNVTTLATVNTVTPGTYGTGTSVPTITVNGKGLVTASSATSIAFPVTLAGNETLTNKTLTSPVITTPTGIVKGDIGLGNVDNTTDLGKPISTATQTALNLKANLASPTFTGTVSGIDKTMIGLTNVPNIDATNAGNISSGTLVIARGGTNSGTALSGSSIMVSNGSAIVQGATGTATTVLHGNLSYSAVSLTADVSGTLPIGNGGTGQATQQAAINTLAGSQTSGQFLRGNGTNVVMSAIQVADVPTLNQSTTGTANIAGGTVGAIPYQTGANATSVLAATATANKVLMSGSNAAPVWSTPAYPNAAGTAGNVIRADVSGNFVSSATATNQINNIDPAGITNNTPRLLRINGATGASITPTKSGKVLVIISGNGVGVDMYVQMYYRITNPAAAHGDATTGFTALGTDTYVSNSATVRSFSLNSVVTGLTIGSTYYFDLAIYSSSSNAVTASNLTVSIVEL